jgi:hypothetical protein
MEETTLEKSCKWDYDNQMGCKGIACGSVGLAEDMFQ